MLLTYLFNLFFASANWYPKTPSVKVHDIYQSQSQLAPRYGRSSLTKVHLDTSSPPLAYTESGWVRGYFQKTITGRPIAAFEGIPYGKAPVGELRFRQPEPAKPWSGVRNAMTRTPMCLQMDFKQLFRPYGVEDCLQLSVYTPADSSLDVYQHSTGLPVLVYIHGGGYSWWSSAEFGPAYLLNKDVILVTVNYRVGILGFLSTGDSVASGNWGLKDQVLALKWVSKNIRHFGGDPSRVTVTGISTGSSAAALHTISKQSRGLIHRAICEGGTAFNHFSIINDTFASSKIVAKGVNCPTSNSKAMIDCLRRTDGKLLVSQMIKTWKELVLFKVTLGPVIEPDWAEEAFLTEYPAQTYLKGEVSPIPIIFGVNRNEGGIFAASLYLTPMMLGRFNRHWERMASYALVYDGGQTNDVAAVSKKINDFYLHGQSMSFRNRDNWNHMIGDRGTFVANYHAIQYHSAIAPTYGYFFTHEGTSLLSMLGLKGNDWGISHADTTSYLYNSTTYKPLEYGTSDYKISEFMVNLWANFAATGVPFYTDKNGERIDMWEKVKSPDDVQVLKIDKSPKMIPMPYQDRIRFWESLNLRNDNPYHTDSIDNNSL